jgi:hypothetical protein
MGRMLIGARISLLARRTMLAGSVGFCVRVLAFGGPGVAVRVLDARVTETPWNSGVR